MRNRTPVVFLAGALALSAGNAAAVPYTFTNLYDTSGPFGEFRTTPSLNNSGTVAFFAILDTGERGVFTGSGGPTTTIADEGGRFIELPPSSPSLNESGTVAFSARLS